MDESRSSKLQAAQPRHRIIVCTSCRGKTPESEPGQALIDGLRAALQNEQRDAAGFDGRECRSEGFEITGVACMAGCGNPCTVAFQAEDKAFYLFGKLDPAHHLHGLVEFARLYQGRPDGWSNSTERPDALRGKTLARIPAFAALREENAFPQEAVEA